MRDALGNVQSVLAVGSDADLLLATAHRLVAHRTRTVVLGVPDPEQVAGAVEELRAAGATTVEVRGLEPGAVDAHAGLERDERVGDLDLVLLGAAPGRVTGEPPVTTAAVALADAAAALLRAQGHGTIVGLAPDRATAMLLRSLGRRLAGTGVWVMVVRCGARPTPGAVADAIVTGLRRGRAVVWVPPSLRFRELVR